MINDWQITTIDDIKAPGSHSLAMGPFGSDIKTDNFVPSGVPIIRGGNLSAERFRKEGFVFLTEEKADELRSANAFPNDIIFTHRGTLGQVGIVPKNNQYDRYVVSQSQMKLTCDPENADPLFIFYFFRSPIGQHKLLANTSTTGVPAISRPLTSLRSIKILLPPLPEQKAIANILGTLDDKIELNRQMNETLESIARTLFKSWFVDFDPVRAKMGGRQPFGMNDETASLFPSEFENSTQVKTPRGWSVKKLGSITDFAYGKPLKENIRQPGNIPVYGSNGQVGWHNEALVEGPGIVIGRKGNPGTVTFAPVSFYPIDTTFYVAPKGEIKNIYYLYYCLRLLRLASLSADSAVPGLNRTIAYMTELIVPTNELIEKFGQMVKPLHLLIQRNNEQSQTLTTLRDMLLPKLLSGEIRVKEAEELVEACV